MQNFQKLIKLPQLLLFLLGNAFVAYSYQGFVSANDFLSGGIYGISGIFTHFIDLIPFSLVVLLFNLPCMIWAWRELEKRFVILTIIALLLQVVFLQLFEGVVIYNNDLLLAAIFAGVFVGLGDGLVLRSGSGSSGVHLIAMVLRQRFGISVSTVTTCINAVIIVLSSGLFGIEKGLYTLILIFASGQTVHAILDGLSSKRTAFIITTKGEEVGEALINGLNRGVTKLAAEGLYTHTSVSLLMCVTNMLEVGRLKSLVQSVDPQAFITFYETTDFRGHFLKHNILVDKDEDEETAAMAPPKRPSRQKPIPEPPPAQTSAQAPTNTVTVPEPKFKLTIAPGAAEEKPALKPQEYSGEAESAPEDPPDNFPQDEEPEEVMELTGQNIMQRLRERILAGEGNLPEAAALPEEPTQQPAGETAPQPVEPAPPNTLPSVSRRRSSVITGDVPRPERRSFVPPPAPGMPHPKSRTNQDFWAEEHGRSQN